MESTPYEARINLALKAIQKDENLSLRAAAKIYNVAINTIRNRRAGKPARHNIPANSHNLMELEETTIVQYVVKLSMYSFPPRLCGVEDMANNLLHAHDASPVGKNWASNFI